MHNRWPAQIFRAGGMAGHRSRSGRNTRLSGIAFFISILLAGVAQPCSAFAIEVGVSSTAELPAHKPETRLLRLRHRWTGELLEVVYKIGDVYQPDAMAEINHFMRDWRCNKTIAMDPKLIDQLYALQQAIGGKRTIRLISAYRSEGYNASLLRAGRTVDPNSQHMSGRAVDVYVPGVPLDRLSKAAEAELDGGIGLYPFSGPRFVHIDTGPKRRWAEMDPGERRKLGLSKRPRTKLVLDCELTMAEVLREIPVDEVIAALPAGASIRSPRSVRPASFASAKSDRPHHDAHLVHREDSAPDHDGRPDPCELNGALSKLDPLALIARPAGSGRSAIAP